MIDKVLTYNILSLNGSDTELTKITGFTINPNTSYNSIQDASSELMTLSTNIFSDTILTTEINVSDKLSAGYIFVETSTSITISKPASGGITKTETKLTLSTDVSSNTIEITGVVFKDSQTIYGVYASTDGIISNNKLSIMTFRISQDSQTHNDAKLLIAVRDKATNNVTINEVKLVLSAP